MLQITSSGPLPHETTPALSIVIPVYNGAATIGELVAALAGLDIPGGIEIVLVNDGSRTTATRSADGSRPPLPCR